MSVRIHILLATAAVTAGAVLPAQGPKPRRAATIAALEPGVAPPRLDGRLDDACWQQAPVLGDLVMVEPWEGRIPDQATVVKLLHDRHRLYIGLYCHDDRPQDIRDTQRARDARLDPDDRVEIMLDPFENRRTAYWFQIGAGGSIGDALVSGNGARFDKGWDTIWDGAARVVADGWVAEIAIPFRSLPRQDGGSSWGFDLRRLLRARNEEHRWANPVQAVPFFRVSELGTLEGFGEIDAGVGLEVVPYVTATAARDRSVDDDWDLDADVGGELYYRITPSMTLAATAMTDFAETEDDGRQINFNRFPLFFPEKRDFFLDGASYFTFGAQRAGGANVLPYFSRRIGLDGNGERVQLLGGLKLTGESGPFELGLLDVQTDDGTTTRGDNLAVARLKYAFDEQTTVGLLATNGDPAGAETNSVVGVDFYHRWPEFVGDLDLQLVLDVMGSTGSGSADDGESFGFTGTARGSELDFRIGTRWVSDDFDPALGFVSRRGIRSSLLQAAYSPRLAEGGVVRSLAVTVGIDRQDRWEGDAQDQRFELDDLGVVFHSDDRIGLFGSRAYERVDADFALFRDSTPVFAGDYWATRGGVYVHTSEGRPWNLDLVASTGDFFDGRRDSVDVEALWRVSPLLHVGGEGSVSRVDLGPGRRFEADVAAARLDLHFDPHLSLYNLAQWDNESEVLGWQSRLRWIYAPGCDFFVVLGTTWAREVDGAYVPREQSLALKVSHSLRF